MRVRTIRSWLGGLLLDLRYVRRALLASPGFTAVAIVSLAVGIGANTAIFSAARVALFDSLPVSAPENLRIVNWARPDGMALSEYNSNAGTDPVSGRATRTNFSWAATQALQRVDGLGAGIFGFNFLSGVTITVPGQPAASGGGLMISGNGFRTLRPPMALGRGLNEQDDTPSATPAVVVGYRFWTTALGADPDVIGRTIQVNDVPVVVVGVTGERFRGLSTGGRFTPFTDVTVPLALQPLVWKRSGEPPQSTPTMLWIRLMARLDAGVRDATVAAALTPVLQASVVQTGVVPEDQQSEVAVVLTPGNRGVDALSQTAGRPLLILSGVAGLVLLIACLNLAGLMLSRGVARQREWAVRRALGAGRLQIIRQFFAESAVLAGLGAAAGLLLLLWTSPVITAMMATGLGADSAELPLDSRSLAVTTVVACGAMLLSGLLPALRFSRSSDATTLRQRALGAAAPRLTAGRVLLAAQIAVSVPLVVTAALLGQTLLNLNHVDLGFNPENLTAFRINPGKGQPMTPERVEAFYARFLEEVEALPGVTSATLVENVLASGGMSNTRATVDGQPHIISMNAVGNRYFETMQMPLLAGRPIGARDTASAPRVVVLNQKAAREIFGSESPLGRRFTLGRSEAEVVGVVADSRYWRIREEVPATLFDSVFQRGMSAANVVVRTAGPPVGLERAVRDAVAATGFDLPVTDFRSQADYIARNIGQERLVARLVGIFGTFAVLLACVGLYGVTAYSVARRTNEIGLRMALGAQRGQVLWLVMRQVLLLAAAGLVIGIPAALAAGPLVGSFLYGLSPRDGATVGIAAGAMLLVALGAGFLPARRASRLEALSALRFE